MRSVLNFAPAVINVAQGAALRKVDLAVELQILSFYQQRSDAERAARASGSAKSASAGQPKGAAS